MDHIGTEQITDLRWLILSYLHWKKDTAAAAYKSPLMFVDFTIIGRRSFAYAPYGMTLAIGRTDRLIPQKYIP